MARIAIVEDDDDVRLTIARILKDGGYEPLLVAPGRGVLERLDELAFDLLVTDIAMAFVDGWEVIRWARRNRPATPVLAVSGGSMFMAPQVGLRLSAGMGAAALAKPFRAKTLLSTISEMIGEHAPPPGIGLELMTVEPSSHIA